MKIIIMGLLLGLLVQGVRASDDDVVVTAQAPYDQRGVSITKYVEGASLTLTNVAVEPWKPTSIFAKQGTGTVNTITIDFKRVYGIEAQYRASDITTNILGLVETNTYPFEVTNTFFRVVTGRVFAATVTGDYFGAISTPFNFKADDVIVYGQTDLGGKAVIISGDR